MLVRSTEPGWIDVRAGAVGPVGAGALGEGGSTVGEAGPPPLTATGFDAGCFEGGAVTGELPPMTATAAPIVAMRRQEISSRCRVATNTASALVARPSGAGRP